MHEEGFAKSRNETHSHGNSPQMVLLSFMVLTRYCKPLKDDLATVTDFLSRGILTLTIALGLLTTTDPRGVLDSKVICPSRCFLSTIYAAWLCIRASMVLAGWKSWNWSPDCRAERRHSGLTCMDHVHSWPASCASGLSKCTRQGRQDKDVATDERGNEW